MEWHKKRDNVHTLGEVGYKRANIINLHLVMFFKFNNHDSQPGKPARFVTSIHIIQKKTHYKGWLPRAKLKKIQEGIVGFGCNFGGMIAHLYRSHSPGYTQIRQG